LRAYDTNGWRTAISRPNGVTSSYGYDAASQVTSITHTGPSGALMSFAYTYDAAGNRTSVTKDGGNPESYTLDALNRLTNVTYADGTTQAYTYDANGNRLSLTVNGSTPVIYSYNDADRLTSDGTNTYTYDANGNLVVRGADSFTWDYASRMTGATIGSTTATYTYDGEDVRVGKTVASTPTSYLWDRESGLPLLVDDGSRGYLHAGGVLGEVSPSAREELIADALGSVRGVADDTGALSGSADFDVYGAVRTSSASTAAFAFTGEQSDPETGFTYLRARYYDPAVGRLGAVDTVIPNAPGTQGYNPYAYVAGNPVRWVDPSGHSATAEAGMFNKRNATAAGPIAALGRLLAGTFDKLSCALDIRCRSLWTVIGTAAAGAATGWAGANPPDKWPPIPVPPTCAFTGSCGAVPASGGGSGSAPAAGGAAVNPPAVGNPPITGTGISNPDNGERESRGRDREPRTSLWRMVSEAEALDIAACGCFRPEAAGRSLEGKWFAPNRLLALAYGPYYPDLTRLVQAIVSRRFANQFLMWNADHGGFLGYFVPAHRLAELSAHAQIRIQ
jgi:RHS repeat-associated protein